MRTVEAPRKSLLLTLLQPAGSSLSASAHNVSSAYNELNIYPYYIHDYAKSTAWSQLSEQHSNGGQVGLCCGMSVLFAFLAAL